MMLTHDSLCPLRYATLPTLAAWLDHDRSLTPVELRILHLLGHGLGVWVPTAVIARAAFVHRIHDAALDQAETRAVRTYVWRLRRKLEPTPWCIENRYSHGLYRLVERQ